MSRPHRSRSGAAGRRAGSTPARSFSAAAALLLCLAPGCRRPGEAALGAGAALAPAQPAPAPQPSPYERALTEGDQAFAERGEPARLAAALAAYARAEVERSGAPEPDIRIARAEAFRALAEDDPARARDAWRASARAAERALRRLAPGWAEAVDRGEEPAAAAARVDGPGAEPLYLLAQGTLRAAQATGYAAVIAVKDAVLAMLNRAAELDERVDAAGPYRLLGSLRAALPIAAGGGAAAARAHFDKARALAPDDLLAPVAEAETLAVLLQDAARFDALLAEVRAADPARDPARAPENRIAQRRAEALEKRRARLF